MPKEVKFSEEEAVLAGANPKFLAIVKIIKEVEKTIGKFTLRPTPQNFNRFIQITQKFAEAMRNLTDEERKQYMQNLEQFIDTRPDADVFRKQMEGLFASMDAFGKALSKID